MMNGHDPTQVGILPQEVPPIPDPPEIRPQQPQGNVVQFPSYYRPASGPHWMVWVAIALAATAVLALLFSLFETDSSKEYAQDNDRWLKFLENNQPPSHPQAPEKDRFDELLNALKERPSMPTILTIPSQPSVISGGKGD